MIVAVFGGDYFDIIFYILWSVSKLYRQGYFVIFHFTSQCFDWGMCMVLHKKILMCGRVVPQKILMCGHFYREHKGMLYFMSFGFRFLFG